MYLQQGNDEKALEIIMRDKEFMNALNRDSMQLMDLYKEKGIEGVVTRRVKYQLKHKKFGYSTAAEKLMFIDNRDFALDCLEKAFESRETQMIEINAGSFEALRDEPRFKAILNKMGLEDQ